MAQLDTREARDNKKRVESALNFNPVRLKVTAMTKECHENIGETCPKRRWSEH